MAVTGLDERQLAVWPDEAWRRLIADVADPGRVWAAAPRCRRCGRPVAGSDCEPDPCLCWGEPRGRCSVG